jgi:archaellin
VISDVAWAVSFAGANDGDFSLEATEHVILSVWLVEYDYDNDAGLYYMLGSTNADPLLGAGGNLRGNFTQFTLERSPVRGAPLQIERTAPQSLNEVMNLR